MTSKLATTSRRLFRHLLVLVFSLCLFSPSSLQAASYCYDSDHQMDNGSYFWSFFTSYNRDTIYNRLASNGYCGTSGGGRTNDSPCRGLRSIIFDNMEICRANEIHDRSKGSTYGYDYPFNQNFPSFNVHWAYVTNSGCSCSDDKRWNINMRKDDCPGYRGSGKNKANECPSDGSTKYHTGPEYFEYLCDYACDLYHDLSGNYCSEIVDQQATGMTTWKENWVKDSGLYGKTVEFMLGDPVKKRLLEAAIDQLNEYLEMARAWSATLGKVSPANLGILKGQINEIEGVLNQVQSNAEADIRYTQCRVSNYYNSIISQTCNNNAIQENINRDNGWREMKINYTDCTTGRGVMYPINCCDNYGTWHDPVYRWIDGVYTMVQSGYWTYTGTCNTTACYNARDSWCRSAQNALPGAYESYHAAYEWAHREDDKYTYYDSDCSTTFNTSHRCYIPSNRSFPYYRNEYINPQRAVVNKKLAAYEESVRNEEFKDSWRSICPGSWAATRYNITLPCVAVNLLEGCRIQANKVMESESINNPLSVSHRSQGYLTVYTDRHRCTGDSDLVSDSHCYKWACYQEHEYCRNINPFYVEPGETCYVGTKVKYNQLVTGKTSSRRCDMCANFSTCEQAKTLGYRFDTQATDITKAMVHGYYIDIKNSERYWTITGSCTDPTNQICRDVYNSAGVQIYDTRSASGHKGQCAFGNKLTCASLGYTANCAARTDGKRTPVNRNFYDKKTGGWISCTVDCTDTCAANGLVPWNKTRCSVGSSCINGESTCPYNLQIQAHSQIISGVTCYDARCAPAALPDSNDDICIQHGFLPNGYQCKLGREVSLGTVTITYYPNDTGNAATTTCVKGCRLIEPDQRCSTQGHTSDNRYAGNVWTDHTETRYLTLARWEITRGQQSIKYTDYYGSNAHTHYKIYAPNGSYVAESVNNNAKVCRFDGCKPNDAAQVRDEMERRYGSCNRRYNLEEIGMVYDGCDQIYTFRRCVAKNWGCAPTCRRDDDLGFGTYNGDCEKPGSTRAVNTDTCEDDGSSSGSYRSTIACKVPTCATGYTLSLYDVDSSLGDSGHSNINICGSQTDVDCNHRIQGRRRNGAVTYFDDACYGKGGTYACDVISATPDNSNSACTWNARARNTKCYRVFGCDIEYDKNNVLTTNSLHPNEFGSSQCGTAANGNKCRSVDKQIFIPAGRSDTWAARLQEYGEKNVNYKAGINGLRCGMYVAVSEPQWATSNSNSNIYTTDPNGADTGATDGRCDPASYSVTLDKNSFTLADAQISYEYFNNLIQINKLKACGNRDNSYLDDDGKFYLCRADSSITSKQLQDWNWLDAQVNAIIFVDNGDFTINTNIVTDEGYFKAFIVRNKIRVDKGVGKLPKYAYQDNRGCSTATSADLQGFFGADEFIFDHGKIVADSQLNPFNETIYCDRQLVIAGSVVQWGNKNLKLTRTFQGCVGGDEGIENWNAVMANPSLYPDYNSFLSPHVFYQRPDFENAAPSWMKSQQQERTENN